MDNLQGGVSASTPDSLQGTSPTNLLPQSNTVQSQPSSQLNFSNLTANNLSVVPSCHQNCAVPVATPTHSLNSPTVSTGWLAGTILITGVLAVGLFARKVLNS